MNPVPKNKKRTSHGCSQIMSTNCIDWVGDLPDCINHCPGDNLTDVIQAIATVACNAFETSQYNTAGINQIITENGGVVVEGDDFTTIIKNIQESISVTNIRIDEIAKDLAECCEQANSNQLPNISTCLISNQLPLEQAIETSFIVVCETFEEIFKGISETQKAADQCCANVLEQIAVINKENAQLSKDIAEVNACARVKVGPHELTGPIAGNFTCAGSAVEYLANKVAARFAMIGEVAAIGDAISQQSSTLYLENSLSQPGQSLGNIGVLPVVNTLAGSLQQAWIVLQDLRTGFINTSIIPSDACATIPVRNLNIDQFTDTSVQISWEAHGISGIEDEDFFNVEVFAYDGTTAVGPVLASSYNLTDVTVASVDNTALSPGVTYVVRVTSNYSCGTAQTEVVGEVKSCVVDTFAKLEVIMQTVNDVCDGTNYDKISDQVWRILLVDSLDNPVNNTTGSDIIVQVKVPVELPGTSAVVYEIYDITIPNNDSIGVIGTQGDLYYKQFTNGVCEEVRRGLNLISGEVIEVLQPALCNIAPSQNIVFTNIGGSGPA